MSAFIYWVIFLFINEYWKRFNNKKIAINTQDCSIDKLLPALNKKRTGGLLLFCFSCGFIANITEIIRSESLTLIKAKLTELNKKQPFKYCIYDNACHLSSSVQNHNHFDLLPISFYIDRFHINNHSNEKCKTTHNLANNLELKDINSEVCEQKNYLFNKVKHNTKHMSKNHFMLFF